MQCCVELGYFDVDKEMLIFSNSEQYSHADNKYKNGSRPSPNF